LDAKSTHDLIVADNQISRNGVKDGSSDDSQEIVRLWACSGVEIVGNTIEDNRVAIVQAISMKAGHLAIDKEQASIIRRDYEDET
jgi:nitrous oxidase accessory protein NosD